MAEIDGVIDSAQDLPLQLVRQGQGLPVIIPARPSETECFAAQELARYLSAISGAVFELQAAGAQLPIEGLLVGRRLAEQAGVRFSAEQFGEDGFLIRRLGRRLLLAGSVGRATLYAVYGFLEKLGCRWFAPNFDFYAPAGGECLPKLEALQVGDLDEIEKPSFQLRKKFIGQGRSHTTENLKHLVDWMAKARLNVLSLPVGYGQREDARWDNWRSVISPEMRKRGLMTEVGGHGYQNFLPPAHYFDAHPEWFGMLHGRRSRAEQVVFATSNTQAVDAFIGNIKAYLREHREIDIFDCWPPDSARWSDAPEDIALGTPTERHMRLLNQVADALKPEFPALKVQFIAYSSFLNPPKANRPADHLLMDFCPINRSWESSLFEEEAPQNRDYLATLKAWLSEVMEPRAISIYTYITKYFWRSLPVLVPHIIAEEARRFEEIGIGGQSTYSEPACWATYELDHYVFSRYNWNARLDLDDELADYAEKRYGAAAEAVTKYLTLVEEVVPHAIAIPGTQLDLAKQRRMIDRFNAAARLLEEARHAAGENVALSTLIEKLEASRRYADNEMRLRLAFLLAGSRYQLGQFAHITQLLAERETIIDANRATGVIQAETLRLFEVARGT